MVSRLCNGMKQPGGAYRKIGNWNLETELKSIDGKRNRNPETDNGKKRQTQRFTISFCLNLISKSYH